jgi:hypothetical protein
VQVVQPCTFGSQLGAMSSTLALMSLPLTPPGFSPSFQQRWSDAAQ